MKKIVFLLWLGLLGLLAGPALAQSDGYAVGDRLSAGAAQTAEGFREIEWDALIPADWVPEELFEGLFDDVDLESLTDADPRALELMKQVQEVWDSAPVVAELDGQRVRIPGFVVPLEGDAKNIREFLLVPYFGACVHVPPPPANQLILVQPEKPIPAEWNMWPVWVSGVMGVEREESELGTSGYTLQGLEVVEYE